ncbi:MAG TPA: rubredoxin [Verrucomicrobiae bacterium]|nr:rubredoxin [Verrucomicrobiae bacterium]
MKIWKCGVCGYLHDGDEAPEHCPKCGAPREKFTELPSEAVELVSKSRRTNDIHMELATLLDRVVILSQEGSDINLDPGCKAIFEKGKASAHTLRQQIKAEVQTHMNKGKWG